MNTQKYEMIMNRLWGWIFAILSIACFYGAVTGHFFHIASCALTGLVSVVMFSENKRP